MDVRFTVGRDRPQLRVQVPDGSALPRIGELVALTDPDSGEVGRWAVRNVVWDYSDVANVAVDVHVSMDAAARIPSFASYTD